MAVGVRVGRAYDPPTSDDGARVLVDRLWPRGLSKAKAALDEWCKEIAPSNELRLWYGHDPARFAGFRTRYLAELTEPGRAEALETLRVRGQVEMVTLVTATKVVELSHAVVLAAVLSGES